MTKERAIEILDAFGGINGDYSGGNDSGGINDLEFCNVKKGFCTEAERFELKEWIEDQVYKVLDYGSWSGNWEANGTISYHSGTKTIIVDGTEHDEEDIPVHTVINLDVLDFLPPEDVPRIDSVTISIYDDNSSWSTIRASINIKNGAWTKALVEAEQKILKRLNEIHDQYPHDDDYRYYIEDQVLPVNDQVSGYSLKIGKVVPKEIYHVIEVKWIEDKSKTEEYAN